MGRCGTRVVFPSLLVLLALEHKFHAGDAVYSSLVKRVWSCTHGIRTDPQHTTALKEL